MSSLRNAVKRVTHKERSQPQHRSHLGLLEKHKDYKVRAVDYHRKEDRIQAARQKASFRNPDEFYFGMKRAQIHGDTGKHRKTKAAEQAEWEASIGMETVRIMKDQDLSYVRMQKQRDVKKVERLQASLHYIEGSSGSTSMDGATAVSLSSSSSSVLTRKRKKHTVFVDTNDEAERFSVAEHFDTLPALAGRAFNRPRLSALQQQTAGPSSTTGGGQDHSNSNGVVVIADAATPSRSVALPVSTTHTTASSKDDLIRAARLAKRHARTVAKSRVASYAEMEARTKRIAALERAEAHLVTERLVASKGRKRKIAPAVDGRPAVYVWRRQRLG